MDEIRKRDIQVFLRECLGSSIILIWLVSTVIVVFNSRNPWVGAAAWVVISAVLLTVAYFKSIKKRFHNPRLKALWADCEDRMKRLAVGLKKLRRQKFADLVELPRTVASLGPQIYRALRRADLVAHEIYTSERAHLPTVNQNPASRLISDTQAQELFNLASRNLIEYSSHFQAAVAVVERAEAQAVVFSTTLDNLRIQMLNYRLSAKQAEAETLEFLHVINEAKLQFAAIDTALEELSEAQYPALVAVDPSSPLHPSAETKEQDVTE